MIILIVFCAKLQEVTMVRGSSLLLYLFFFRVLIRPNSISPRESSTLAYDATAAVVVARNVTSAAVCVPADDEPRASAVLLLCLVGLNFRSEYGRGALPSTHGVPHDSADKKAKLHTGLFSKSFSASETSFDARFEPYSGLEFKIASLPMHIF